MTQPQIFTDENMRLTIENSNLSEEEKQKFIGLLPDMDQSLRAQLTLNLMVQETIDHDEKALELINKYKDDPEELERELEELDFGEQQEASKSQEKQKLSKLREGLAKPIA